MTDEELAALAAEIAVPDAYADASLSLLPVGAVRRLLTECRRARAEVDEGRSIAARRAQKRLELRGKEIRLNKAIALAAIRLMNAVRNRLGHDDLINLGEELDALDTALSTATEGGGA